MGKLIIYVVALFLCQDIGAQKKAEDFGYRHFQLTFESEEIDILVKSKPGDESKKKPVYFEVQGSLAVPLIVHNGDRMVSYASLSEGFIEDDYHLVLVSKPGIPLICHKDSLSDRNVYKDRITNQFPSEYLNKNHLEYYVRRNNSVIEFLKRQQWVDHTKLVVAGHSEGSTIAAHMADKINGITHLIYSGGLPYFPRILAMILKERKMEQDGINPWVDSTYKYWENVITYPFALTGNSGWNTNSGTYSFSKSENDLLKRLSIPVLISYGLQDESAPFNDMFHIEAINDKISNISFSAYVGLNHNYLTVQNNGEIDYETDNIQKVVSDWKNWLKEH